MFKRLLLVLFSCLVFQQKSLAEESYGYSRNLFPTIPCPTNPFVNETGFPSTQSNSTIDCSLVIPPELKPVLKCERFPDVEDDPLPCAKRNYKVLAINLTEQSRNQIEVHAWLANYSSVISKECLNNISNMICKTMFPACDRNESMIVELVSRQDCERIVSCLNTTSNVTNLRVNKTKMCKPLPDATKARKIPLSLVYIEFENNVTPKTHSNDTKTDTTLTTQSPIRNKTQPTQNGTGESNSPSTPTQRSFLNLTDQLKEEATMSVKISPTMQANMTIPNPKSTTEKPTVNDNATNYQEKKEAKSIPNLPPTTKRPSSPNYTSHSQNDTELPKTPKINTTSSLVNVSRGNTTKIKTTENPGTNRPHSKAAQFNKRLNVLAFLLISFLSMCTHQ